MITQSHASPQASFELPLCNRLNAVITAAELLACSRLWPGKFAAVRFPYGAPPRIERFEHPDPDRDEILREWKRQFVRIVAEFRSGMTDACIIEHTLEIDRPRERNEMEATSARIGATPAERYAVKNWAEDLVESRWETIELLAEEIRFARGRIDSNHPLIGA